MPPTIAPLPHRAVLCLSGPDRLSFLQGLVSNDVRRCDAGQAVFAALLTAQGRFLHDFFIITQGERLLLETEGPRAPDLLRRLRLYKLRAAVELEMTDFTVAAVFGDGAAASLGLGPLAGTAASLASGQGVAFVDPRLAELGVRVLLEKDAQLDAGDAAASDAAAYDRWRLSLGVPDGSRDLVLEKALLLENNYDELHAIDWRKGCYIGQELTARTRYRGLVRRRLVPVSVDGPLPPPETLIHRLDAEGQRVEMGEMRSGDATTGRALALLKLDALTGAQPLLAGEAKLTVILPAWLTVTAAPPKAELR